MAPQKKQGKKGGPQKPELWYVINFGDCKEAYLGVKQLRSANKKKINPDEVTVGVNLEAVWGGKYYVGTVERVSIVEPKLTKKEREVRTQVEREKESKKVTKQTKKKIDALRKKQVDKTRRMIREKIRRQHEDQEDEDQEDEDQEDEDQEDEDQEEGEEDADQEEEEGEEGEEDADQEDVENGKRGLKRSREVEKETEKEKAKKPKKLREQGEGEEGTVDQRLERLEKKVKILSALMKTLGQVKKIRGVWKKALHQDFPEILVPVAVYHRACGRTRVGDAMKLLVPYIFTDDELAETDAISDIDHEKIAALVGFAIMTDLAPMTSLSIERSVRKYISQRASDLRQAVKKS